MSFKERLKSLMTPDEGVDVEQVYTELGAEYDDLDNQVKGARASVEMLTESNKTLEAEVQRLQAKNFELLERIGVDVESRSDAGEATAPDDFTIVFD